MCGRVGSARVLRRSLVLSPDRGRRALRHDDEFLHVSAWEFTEVGKAPILHKEPLVYEYIELKQRSYK